MCHKERNALKGTSALLYVEWGEKQEFDKRPSCRSRQRWYDFPEREWAKVLWPMIHNDRQNVFWNSNNVAVDHNLFEILGYDNEILWGSLAWTAQILFRELHGRANLGQGALKTEGIDIRTFYALGVKSQSIIMALKNARSKLSLRATGSVQDESKSNERRSLDNIIFDILGLTQGERDAVYEAVINLVEARLKKAGSLHKS